MLTRNDSIILSQQVDVQKRKPLLKRIDSSGKEQPENGCSFLLIISVLYTLRNMSQGSPLPSSGKQGNLYQHLIRLRIRL